MHVQRLSLVPSLMDQRGKVVEDHAIPLTQHKGIPMVVWLGMGRGWKFQILLSAAAQSEEFLLE